MTTRKQIQALAKPLIERHTDLVLIRDAVVIKPVRHIMRGIFIDRTGDANVFEAYWFVGHLLARMDDFPYGLGDLLHINGPYRPGLWQWSDQYVAGAFMRVAEDYVLPKLRPIQTLRDYFDALLPKFREHPTLYWGYRFIIGIALNDLAGARVALDDDARGGGIRMLNEFQPGLGDRFARDAPHISVDDRRALARMLREQEAYSVAKLKLNEIWERVPLPLEVATEALVTAGPSAK